LNQQGVQNDVAHKIAINGLAFIEFKTVLHTLQNQVHVALPVCLKCKLKNTNNGRDGYE
jgi:hypothetical protein